MAWALKQQDLRDKRKLGPGGETGPVNDMVRHTFERTGAPMMGKHMFEGGKRGWPEKAPFHTAVYTYPSQTRTLGASRRDDLLLYHRRAGACP
jgi:hypothetical protein